MREVDVQFEILRGGAHFGWLLPAEDSVPTLSMDSDSELKTALTGVFVPDDTVDLMSDEISPQLIVDGVSHSLGVYQVADSTPETVEASNTLTIEAYDRCWQVQTVKTESLLHLAAGARYVDTVEQLLVTAGISTVIATPSTAVLTEDREDWDIGTDYLTIINQLLGEINYKSLWFNAQGVAILEPQAVPTAANIKHTLDGKDPACLLEPTISRSTDLFQAPNVWILVCSNPDKSAPLVAKSENTNPQSPLSIARRGRRIAELVTVNNVGSQSQLQAMADRMRDDSLISGETINVITGLLPGYGVQDVTALHFDDLDAICVEAGFEMELAPGGSMRHKLRRIIYALDI